MRFAWIVILVADAAAALYGLMLMLVPAELLDPGYTMLVGQGWQTLQARDPLTAGYFAMLSRVLGALNIAFGVLGIAVAVGPFRRRESWAWPALLVGNAFGYGGPIAMDFTVGAIGMFEQIEILLFGLVCVALALSARDVLGSAARKTRVAGDYGARYRPAMQ